MVQRKGPMTEFLKNFFNDPFHYSGQIIMVIFAIAGVIYVAKEYLGELFGKDSK